MSTLQFVPYSAELAHRLGALFDGDRPVAIRLWSILDGASLGRILVDTPHEPTFALVQELAEGTTYVGGNPDAAMLAAGIAQLQLYQPVAICLWPEDPLIALLPASPVYQGAAIDFSPRSARVDLRALSAVPAGYTLRRIDSELVPLLEGFDYYVSMFGSIDHALAHTMGYSVLHGAEVVCEAVAGPLARGVAEIGVGTKETHRRKGLALCTAACVIQACEDRGYQAFWNAAQQNTASRALAHRLGFQAERPFAVFAWVELPEVAESGSAG